MTSPRARDLPDPVAWRRARVAGDGCSLIPLNSSRRSVAHAPSFTAFGRWDRRGDGGAVRPAGEFRSQTPCRRSVASNIGGVSTHVLDLVLDDLVAADAVPGVGAVPEIRVLDDLVLDDLVLDDLVLDDLVLDDLVLDDLVLDDLVLDDLVLDDLVLDDLVLDDLVLDDLVLDDLVLDDLVLDDLVPPTRCLRSGCSTTSCSTTSCRRRGA